ncbi:MAG TPA: restriction endonuclease subunit S [Candidatus Mailhella merdigallinarum]|uniref:Restriction endonuclease subunit S n=1 Tax=Candidatus Mailhella merdigallinarum TaxID=2838658 RepID=A0A9D2HD13_9BACT|nr:restriction endonuclease subunit S [Candidatus Mailhella merdigallinarum]
MARPRKNAARAQDSLLTPDEVAQIPVEEQPYPLPEGWKWVRLGDAAEIVMGQSPSGADTTDDSSYTPLIGGASDMGQLYPEATKYTKRPTKLSDKNDIIVCIRATLGRPVFSNGEYCLGRGVAAIRSNKIFNQFTRFLFINFEQYLYDNATGTTFAQVNSDTLNKMPIPLPPFDEQQRIVDRIESLFAKLDEAKSKAEAVLDGFEIRKAAILHKAFTGELTAKWREIRGIKKENNAVKIKDILSDIKYGTSEKSDYTYTGLPVIRIPNITGSSVDLEDLKFLKSSKSSDYDLVERNDILMIRSNGSRELVGKCALVDEAIVGKAYASFLIRLRPNPTINPKYLLGFLNSSLARNQLFAKAKSSAGIHNINSKEICSVDIWLPDKKEQQEIVRILDNLLAKERHIREAAENVLSQIGLMKKAILARAFRGELGTHGSARDTLQNNGSM